MRRRGDRGEGDVQKNSSTIFIYASVNIHVHLLVMSAIETVDGTLVVVLSVEASERVNISSISTMVSGETVIITSCLVTVAPKVMSMDTRV